MTQTIRSFLTSQDLIVGIRKARRELKEFIRIANVDEREKAEAALDSIIEMCLDDIPVPEWPPATSQSLVSVISACVRIKANDGSDAMLVDATRKVADL